MNKRCPSATFITRNLVERSLLSRVWVDLIKITHSCIIKYHPPYIIKSPHQVLIEELWQLRDNPVTQRKVKSFFQKHGLTKRLWFCYTLNTAVFSHKPYGLSIPSRWPLPLASLASKAPSATSWQLSTFWKPPAPPHPTLLRALVEFYWNTSTCPRADRPTCRA